MPEIATRPKAKTHMESSNSSSKHRPKAAASSVNAHKSQKIRAEPESPLRDISHSTNTESSETRSERVRRTRFQAFAKAIRAEWKTQTDNDSKRNFQVLEPIHKMGMALHCNVNMTVLATAVVTEGIDDEIEDMQISAQEARSASGKHEQSNEIKDRTTQLSDREFVERLKHIDAYKLLTRYFPDLGQRLLECSEYDDTKSQDIIEKTLQLGITECSRNDRRTLKSGVINWIPRIMTEAFKDLGKNPSKFEFPALSNSILKSERGMNHPQTAALLMSWKDGKTFWIDAKSSKDVDLIMRDVKNGKYPPMTSDTLPAFLWDWSKWNPNQMLSGFLQGPLLIAAFKAVMFGPTAALERELSDKNGGNAKIRSVKEVTAENLAYIASQLRFSLSPLQSFKNTDGKFDNRKFYTWLVTTIKDAPESWRRKTFRKLNSEIFGDNDDTAMEEPDTESDLMTLQQHFHDYVDSEDDENDEGNISAAGTVSPQPQSLHHRSAVVSPIQPRTSAERYRTPSMLDRTSATLTPTKQSHHDDFEDDGEYENGPIGSPVNAGGSPSPRRPRGRGMVMENDQEEEEVDGSADPGRTRSQRKRNISQVPRGTSREKTVKKGKRA